MKRDVVKRVYEDAVRKGVLFKNARVKHEVLSCGHLFTNRDSLRNQIDERECKLCGPDKGSKTGNLKRAIRRIQGSHDAASTSL